MRKDSKDNFEMNRRSFIWNTTLGGSVLLLGGGSCTSSATEESEAESSAAKTFELAELTIAQLQEGMESGRFSTRTITEMYLSRIEELNRQGPALRAIIESNPDALSLADALDEERKQNGSRGPLHGIPIVLKDNIGTADRMTTTAGSLALEGSIPQQDSFVAQKLREAGAILLAKANLSEWANFRSDRSSSGWSARGGQCRNPYVLDRNPCGSSSGSGVATAANLCAASIGTETNGSIVCPSNANGVVGIKPTVGLVGRSGIIPISHTQDTAGPMTRTVEDAAAVLGALAGTDPRDPMTFASQGNTYQDYTRFLNPDGLKGARIGVARQYFGFHERVDALMESAIEEMKRMDATIVDPADIPTREELRGKTQEILLYEFKAALNAYLVSLGARAPVHSLAEIIEFNEKNKDREMPYFGQEIFIRSQETGPLTINQYQESLARNRELTREKGIDQVMNEHRLDTIVAPTGGPAWVTDLITGDHFLGGSSTFAAVAGYPNISVPLGYVSGLPVGISFFGRAWSEPTLIKVAYAFEQATKVRNPPQFIPTLELEGRAERTRIDG